MASPTQLTIRHYLERGYLVDVVERWVPRANIRRDLFGVIDLVAITADEPLIGIQATSISNVSARLAKARASAALAVWLRTGARFIVIGWAKRAGRWHPKIVEMRGDDMIVEVTVSIPRKKRKGRWQPLDLFAGIDGSPTNASDARQDTRKSSGDPKPFERSERVHGDRRQKSPGGSGETFETTEKGEMLKTVRAEVTYRNRGTNDTLQKGVDDEDRRPAKAPTAQTPAKPH
jgi:hypothetical protein